MVAGQVRFIVDQSGQDLPFVDLGVGQGLASPFRLG
jgi:hypothetical protein